MDTLKGYEEAFDEAFGEAWKSYAEQWKDAIRCDYAPYKFEPRGIDIPILKYGAAWITGTVPTPNELALSCHNVLCSISNGQPQVPYWEWDEGCEVMFNPPLVESLSPGPCRLVVRIPWEIHIEHEWRLDDDALRVRGRFGFIPCD